MAILFNNLIFFLFFRLFEEKNLLKLTKKFTRNLLIVYLDKHGIGWDSVNKFNIYNSWNFTISSGGHWKGDVVVVLGATNYPLKMRCYIYSIIPNDSNFNTINMMFQSIILNLYWYLKFLIVEKNDLYWAYPMLTEFKKVKFIKKWFYVIIFIQLTTE